MKPALEFGVFTSVLPLDYHGADAALPTCVPVGLLRVHSSIPLWLHQSLQVPHVPYPLLAQCLHS